MLKKIKLSVSFVLLIFLFIVFSESSLLYSANISKEEETRKKALILLEQKIDDLLINIYGNNIDLNSSLNVYRKETLLKTYQIFSYISYNYKNDTDTLKMLETHLISMYKVNTKEDIDVLFMDLMLLINKKYLLKA